MPQKTRKEKILTEKRKLQQRLISQTTPTYSLDIQSVPKTPSIVHTKQASKITTGHMDLKKELLKISFFTLGAVAFQLILFFFVIK